MYIWQLADWPHLTWDSARLAALLVQVAREQGRLFGRMQGLGFDLRRCQLWLGVPDAVEAGRRRRAREGDRGGGAGRIAVERALSGLAVRCHRGVTSFRTTATTTTAGRLPGKWTQEGGCASGDGPHRGSGPPPDFLGGGVRLPPLVRAAVGSRPPGGGR